MEVKTREELGLPFDSKINFEKAWYFNVKSKSGKEEIDLQDIHDTVFTTYSLTKEQVAFMRLAANQYHAMREGLDKISKKCSCDFSMSKAVHDDDCCKMIAQKALAGGVDE